MVIAWFNVESPSYISVTDLKEDPQSLFSVEREIRVPGMDAPSEILEAALAQNEAHEAYRKGLYRAVSQNFSTGFAGRMFRQNLVDRRTAGIGEAMREKDTEIKRERANKAKRVAALDRKAAQLGIAPGAISNRPGAEEGLEEMTAAMRRFTDEANRLYGVLNARLRDNRSPRRGRSIGLRTFRECSAPVPRSLRGSRVDSQTATRHAPAPDTATGGCPCAKNKKSM
jgi:hypothetical protein